MYITPPNGITHPKAVDLDDGATPAVSAEMDGSSATAPQEVSNSTRSVGQTPREGKPTASSRKILAAAAVRRDSPTYEALMKIDDRSAEYSGYKCSRSLEGAFIKATRADPPAFEYSGHKFHINVPERDLERAYSAISDKLFSVDSPIHEWDFVDSSRSVIDGGAPVILYRPSGNKGQLDDLNVTAFLTEIDSALREANVSHCPALREDTTTPWSDYISYLNETGEPDVVFNAWSNP